eukprot:ANDGO_05587.mRNA.1 hypothetical protein
MSLQPSFEYVWAVRFERIPEVHFAEESSCADLLGISMDTHRCETLVLEPECQFPSTGGCHDFLQTSRLLCFTRKDCAEVTPLKSWIAEHLEHVQHLQQRCVRSFDMIAELEEDMIDLHKKLAAAKVFRDQTTSTLHALRKEYEALAKELMLRDLMHTDSSVSAATIPGPVAVAAAVPVSATGQQQHGASFFDPRPPSHPNTADKPARPFSNPPPLTLPPRRPSLSRVSAEPVETAPALMRPDGATPKTSPRTNAQMSKLEFLVGHLAHPQVVHALEKLSDEDFSNHFRAFLDKIAT